jgi:hypothetical protein
MHAMAQNQVNSIVTTTSGIFGGLGKVLSTNIFLAAITIQTLLEVAVYASVSALVGYGIKQIIDLITKFLSRKHE